MKRKGSQNRMIQYLLYLFLILPMLISNCKNAYDQDITLEDIQTLLKALIAVGLFVGAPVLIVLIIALPIMAAKKTGETISGYVKANEKDKTYNPLSRKEKIWNATKPRK